MDIKEQKRKAIADTAKELFSNYGYKMVSMDKIAQKSDVAKGTLYLYFNDKKELFDYLLDEVLMEIKELVNNIKRKKLSISDEVSEVVYNLLLYRKSQKFIYRIFSEAIEFNTNMANNSVKKINDLITEYLHESLSQIVDEREINKEVLAFVIIKVYSALAFEWEETHEPLSERQIAKTIGSLLKGTICKDSI